MKILKFASVNRKELQIVMLVMVILIVMLFSAVGYIWFSEVRYPLFGRHAASYRELSELKTEVLDYKKLTDSLRQQIVHSEDYCVAAELPDSLIHPEMETFQNGSSKFVTIGKFKMQQEAEKTIANLKAISIFRCSIFKKVGDQFILAE